MASATMPPPCRKMTTTAIAHSTLRSVRTSMGTRLLTRSWKSEAEHARPVEGHAEQQDHPATSIWSLRSSSSDAEQREHDHRRQQCKPQQHHRRRYHSCSCSGSRRGFAHDHFFHPEVREVADEREHDEEGRPLADSGAARAARDERRDDHAEGEVEYAHDDLHEHVMGGVLARCLAGWTRWRAGLGIAATPVRVLSTVSLHRQRPRRPPGATSSARGSLPIAPVPL